jgi:hypothetical protein
MQVMWAWDAGARGLLVYGGTCQLIVCMVARALHQLAHPHVKRDLLLGQKSQKRPTSCQKRPTS